MERGDIKGNTKIVFRTQERARELNVRNVLVATNTGKSIEAAQDSMGPESRFYAVGSPSSARDKGLVLHCGITAEVKERLEERGITVFTRADSGQLPLAEDCMAIAAPNRYSHAALVAHPVTSEHLFGTHSRVKDLALAPSDNDSWSSDGPIP